MTVIDVERMEIVKREHAKGTQSGICGAVYRLKSRGNLLQKIFRGWETDAG
jgi:hypothetical protein